AALDVAVSTMDGLLSDEVGRPRSASRRRCCRARPRAPATRVTGTVAGDYVFRFFGDDGARRSVATVAVTLAPKAVVAEFGATATVTTSGTAPWENHSRVSERTNPTSSNPGAGNGWGNWGQQQNGTSVERAGWIQYAWTSPVRLSSADVYWYDDNGGTRRPNADTYAIETSADGTTWTPVTLVNGSSYAGGLATNAYNHFDFAPLDTRLLRIRIWGVQSGGAGTGVLRWRANGEAVDTVRSPVLVRTTVGEVPVLPGALDIGYASGARGTAGFQWQPITPAMVAETNVDPFVVYGTNDTYGLIAEARVYVRPETAPGGISIQGVESFTRSVAVGEQPYLPDKVEVSYNDGSRDNQAIGVRWRFDPDVVDTPGRYTVIGDLVLPPYVGDAGATRTTLTLTVGTDTVAPTTSIAWSPAGTGEWFTTVPSFTLTAQDAFGVEGTSYRVDDGDWTAYAGTPVAVAGEGSHQVTYRSVDVTGNVESPRTATVRVDTVAPAAAFSSAIGDVHEGSVPPAPTCTATDATSGPRGCVVSGYATAVGTHTVTATATDNAGNVGTATQTYRVLPRCTTTITGTRPGPLVVTAGLTCVERATVNGSVTVGPGASLMVRGGTIAGPLSATGAGTVTLAATTVGGPVSVAGSTGELRITGGRLAGAVSITRGTGGVRLDAVTIGGPVTLTGNTGTAPVVAAANTIGGPLACSGNTPPPTDEGRANTVRGPASGQCAKL
ncbi:Ig-like domain-containing protein, partial [Asanoa sp. NPDC050611]|uniref:Ig-like domain-containing protein n=1 Tax=Asanoa sp. NPDC050611 TaxID=3157098 RepID=UPI00340F0152